MKLYQNKSGKSGVIKYEIGGDFIKVLFHSDNNIYTYNYQAPGALHVEAMKKKAMDGIGLATYINQHVRDDFFGKNE